MTGEGGVIRVLLGWTGEGDFDQEARTFANRLRDSGMDVVFTGVRPRPENLVRAAIQEDVDVICVIGDGAGLEQVLEMEGAGDMAVVALAKEADCVALVRAEVRPGSNRSG
ncbi:MAG: methylmalonyl-CoA mutase [Alphaproteobacteria bacterium]|nr:methylmalonyl-CoA mutase [Alphaproteobacteria bacterium]